MHWNEIAYDKHRCAMYWDCIAYDKLVVQCNRNIQAMHWNEIADDAHR